MQDLGDFRRRMESAYKHLTKSEQRIASYLLSSHDEAAFLPAAELAERLGVSEATVVRFAKSAGYDSFPELRRTLQEIVRASITPAYRLPRRLDELKSGDGHVLFKIVAVELQYLAEAERSIDHADFDRAAETLARARRVFAFGTGPARILAELVQMRLRRLGLATYDLVESGRDLLEKLVPLQPQDVVLAAGFHRVTGELLAVLDHAHRVGSPAVLLTDTLGPALKGKATVIISARRGPVSNFHSLTVPMVILNALIVAVATSRSKESDDYLNRLQELRDATGLDVIGKTST